MSFDLYIFHNELSNVIPMIIFKECLFFYFLETKIRPLAYQYPILLGIFVIIFRFNQRWIQKLDNNYISKQMKTDTQRESIYAKWTNLVSKKVSYRLNYSIHSIRFEPVLLQSALHRWHSILPYSFKMTYTAAYTCQLQ